MAPDTPIKATLDGLLQTQRQAFRADPAPSHAVRADRLERLLALLLAHEGAFIDAIDADFGGRSPHETQLAELFVLRAGIRHARRHLTRWMTPRRVPTQLHFLPARNRLLPQPLGVVGIVSPWNYPLQLSLAPAISALAAGNRVLLKPSELTPCFSALLQDTAARHFDRAELAVVCGDADVGRAFTELPFDHLFFTGSTRVGREVAQAAARNLTPVTLELGGKSPAILDASGGWAEHLPRLAFGKLLNAGQTCIAPDYVLAPEGQGEAIARQLAESVARLYPGLKSNPDYTALASDRQWQRMAALVEDARDRGARIIEINPAGEDLRADARKFPPTLVLGATADMRVLREEIFGPVLPIVEYAGLEAAIAHVNAGERPLALYWFGRDTAARDRVLRETCSGGVTLNDCLWHIAQENQPFGGVGASGMGAYHGQWGFDRFSHLKPVFQQARLSGSALSLFYPPYGRTFERLLTWLDRIV